MPPSLILEVLKVLEAQIALREETRTLEQARPALEEEPFAARAAPLAETQHQLAERVADVVEQIRELPDGATDFALEIALLARVEQVMLEADQLLRIPDTGPPTIAAQTEAIELLLQSRRINPSGGGGGGGSSPGGGGTGETDLPALALVGAGRDRHSQPEARPVEQATGVAGSDLPAEFRSGLDAYFGALENTLERRN